MTTFRDCWELESNEPDICVWLERALQKKAITPWIISVTRHHKELGRGALKVNAFLTPNRHHVYVIFNINEEFDLSGAVSEVSSRLNGAIDQYRKKIGVAVRYPFAKEGNRVMSDG